MRLFSRNALIVCLSVPLNSFTCVAWSGDDGSCGIGAFLCPVPEDLVFHQCSQGLGQGTMIDPETRRHCSVFTYPNGYSKNGTECRTEGGVCGVIQCPAECEGTPPCRCLSKWGLCSLLALNQSVSPVNCVRTCGQACETCDAFVHVGCKLDPSVLPSQSSLLSSTELGLTIGAAATVLVVIIACGTGLTLYCFRHRDYQALPDGTDIAPPAM